MRLATAVGGLIGLNAGLLFGAVPAAALVFLADDFLSSSGPVSEEAAFAVCWGAFVLMNTATGATIGLLLHHSRQVTHDTRPDEQVVAHAGRPGREPRTRDLTLPR